MTDLIKAMNPTAPLTTEEAALGAARVSAVGMVIGAIHQAVGAWYASTPQASETAAKMVEQMTGQAPDAAAMAQQGQVGVMLGGGLVVLQLILAAVQWKKPNMALPIIFLILVIWALGGACLALAMPALGGVQPMWLTLFTVVTMVIAAVTHIASIRGASALDKIRTRAAQEY
jgi:hypothetical protein